VAGRDGAMAAEPLGAAVPVSQLLSAVSARVGAGGLT
jgi:hypothetical protein